MFSRDQLIRTIEKLDQPLLIRFLEYLSESWSLTAYRSYTLLGCSFRQRLEFIFAELAHRFGVKEQRGVLIVLKLSHMDFAEMIGSSRPMATVLIGEMAAEGLLYREGQHQYVIPHAPLRIVRTNESRSTPRHRTTLGRLRGRGARRRAP